MLQELLEQNGYDVVNIKEYNDHIQFKLYNKNKWCIINVYDQGSPVEIAFKIAKQFKNKGEIII